MEPWSIAALNALETLRRRVVGNKRLVDEDRLLSGYPRRLRTPAR
jgi:hypothetical protein